mgnify:FL=1
MAGILNVYRRMERNRRLWIGTAGFFALWHFTSGYHECMCDLGQPVDAEYFRFVRFVFRSLDEPWGALSFWMLIAQRTASDEEAFDLFFSLLKRFDSLSDEERN